MRAISTPVGHSRLHPLHETQRSRASFTEASASVPNCPDKARRSVLARPRVRCFSSRVTRNEGHIVPASNLRQWPLLLHISTAFASPPVRSSPVPRPVSTPVNGSRVTFHCDQSSCVAISRSRYVGGKRKFVASSIFGGFTMRSGLIRFSGSKSVLISRNASLRRGPYCHATHSPRHKPSPCSPE